MAIMTSKTCSSWFRCADPDALAILVRECRTDGEDLMIRQSDDRYMFCCDGQILGCLTEKAERRQKQNPRWADEHVDEAYDVNLFLDRLQKCVAPGDACILMTTGSASSGAAGPDNIWAFGHVVTPERVKGLDLQYELLKIAQDHTAPGWSWESGVFND